MKNIGAVGKDQTNTQQGFKFRGIDQLINAAHPAFIKAGVFVTPEVISHDVILKDVTRANGKAGVDKHVSILVKFTFHAEDGTSVASTIAAEGVDSGDKATNKALSAALKYALIQTLSVPTADMEDGDRTTLELGSAVASSAAATTGADTSPSSAAPVSSFRKRTAPAAAPVSNGATDSIKKEKWV